MTPTMLIRGMDPIDHLPCSYSIDCSESQVTIPGMS
jgi:hypothetical protein